MPSLNHSERMARRKRIAEEINSGQYSIKGAVARYGISIQMARGACEEFGVDLAAAKIRLASRAANAIRLGLPENQVLSDFHIEPKFLREACVENGVTFSAEQPQDLTFEILADLIGTGDTLNQIAKRRGTKLAVVRRLYLRSLKSGIPITKRLKGRSSEKTDRKDRPKIAITIDDAIDDAPGFFSMFTGTMSSRSDIHIIASDRIGTKETIENDLSKKNIKYQVLSITNNVPAYVRNHGIDVLIDNKDENIIGLAENVLVLKVRDAENFCFVAKHWLYSESTGEEV